MIGRRGGGGGLSACDSSLFCTATCSRGRPLPGDDSPHCYSGIGTRAQSRNSWVHVALVSGTHGCRSCREPAAAPRQCWVASVSIFFFWRGGEGFAPKGGKNVLFFTHEQQVREVVGGIVCLYPTGRVGGGVDIIFPTGPLQLLCFDAPSLLSQQRVSVTGGYL